MPRRRQPMPLVGFWEIASRAGVNRSVVSDWRRRDPSFPASVAELHIGPVFWWPDVQRWLARTGRRWDVNLPMDVIRQKNRRFHDHLTKKNPEPREEV